VGCLAGIVSTALACWLFAFLGIQLVLAYLRLRHDGDFSVDLKVAAWSPFRALHSKLETSRC
jgi:hypothetical protein